MADVPFPVPVTMAAVYAAALCVQEAWLAAADALPAPPAYRQGLRQRRSLVYPAYGDPLAALVVNVAPAAGRIEEGTPAIHLPSVIRWGSTPGSRRSAKGTYYLVVPFTHRTRSQPRNVYAVARTLQLGQRLTAGPSSGRAVHAPGMSPYQPRTAANVRLGYTHAAVQEGMRRVPGQRGGTYVTFRTLSQNSPGWTIPAKAGLHLAAQVVREVTPQVVQIVEAAFRQDVMAAVQRWGR